MGEWVYEARTRAGEVQTGIMEADSKEAVQSRLRARQLNPVKVKKKPRELKLAPVSYTHLTLPTKRIV